MVARRHHRAPARTSVVAGPHLSFGRRAVARLAQNQAQRPESSPPTEHPDLKHVGISRETLGLASGAQNVSLFHVQASENVRSGEVQHACIT
jgi:hypothetical protein